MKQSHTFKAFFESEKSGGVVLLVATLLSLFLSNSRWQAAYLSFWELPIADKTLSHYINDGLMTFFFLLIGLELKREIRVGELAQIQNALLPMLGALGGMIVPGIIFLGFNFHTQTQNGAGIPMATDIAFAIGILSLLGNRVPVTLKVFLTALAVIDDLGAVVVIAFFYTQSVSVLNLLFVFLIFVFLWMLNKTKQNKLLPYLFGGCGMWYFMLQSGIHPTITGVLLAFTIPFGAGDKQTAAYRLQHFLHKPVTFFVLPLFAMANTGVTLTDDWSGGLLDINSLGIILGLVVGKPLGILLFCYAGVVLGWCALPRSLSWKIILGAAILAGIGFTMSIFSTLLAYGHSGYLTAASKIAILVASFLAGSFGFLYLRFALKNQ